MSTAIDSLLTSRPTSPNTRNNQPCISGTGISVHRIAVLHNLGHSTEDIVRKYEHLTPAGVHAALAYYFANKQQIDAEIASDEAEAEKIEKEFLDQDTPQNGNAAASLAEIAALPIEGDSDAFSGRDHDTLLYPQT